MQQKDASSPPPTAVHARACRERLWACAPALVPTLARLLCQISAAPAFDPKVLEKVAAARPGAAKAPPNDNNALAQLKLALALVLEAMMQVAPTPVLQQLSELAVVAVVAHPAAAHCRGLVALLHRLAQARPQLAQVRGPSSVQHSKQRRSNLPHCHATAYTCATCASSTLCIASCYEHGRPLPCRSCRAWCAPAAAALPHACACMH